MSKQPQLSLENYQALELNSSDLFSEIQLREFLKTLLTKKRDTAAKAQRAIRPEK